MFDYNLKDEMKITVSGETGTIVGRAEYTHLRDSYWIRYKAADGRAANGWFTFDEIELSK